jgi:outer membrane protein OmpA-like peptidoglycan-associated protein
MRARLLDHLKPPGRDLERLARNRANSVRNYLVKSGKVKTHQVLTKAYPAFESGPRDRLEKSRVELYIR